MSELLVAASKKFSTDA